jgi:hypothetical protein
MLEAVAIFAIGMPIIGHITLEKSGTRRTPISSSVFSPHRNVHCRNRFQSRSDDSRHLTFFIFPICRMLSSPLSCQECVEAALF